MVRRHAVALSACVALTLSLGGCSQLPGSFSSDLSDHAAAMRIWQDPWVAPVDWSGIPGPRFGSNGWVSRRAGSRTTPYAGSVRSVARAELRIAKDAGWAPTSSTCAQKVSIALVGPDDALASLVVAPSRGGSAAHVAAFTRHHLDDDWRVPDVSPRTCLNAGVDEGRGEEEAPVYAPPPDASEPLRTSPLPDEDETVWREETLSTADASLVDEVSADLAERGLPTVPAPTLRTGAHRRSGAAMRIDVDSTTLTEVSATLDGWDLTFTSCGGGGPIRATYVRSFEHGAAVASATLWRGAATVAVRLPTPEGPPPPPVGDIPTLTASPCLDSGVDGGVDGGVDDLTVLGTPAVFPSDLTPVRG